MTDLIAKHGGYKNLKSFQMSEIIYDFTVEFCKRYIDRTYRTDKTNTTYSHNRQADQMIQAARSGKQNISEGSQTSGTSRQSEIRLIDVARASLEELKNDYLDYLRTNTLPLWNKSDPRSLEIRKLAYMSNKSYSTYSSYMSNSESAANCAICLINQANFLLDKQLIALGKELGGSGDFKDRYKEIKKKQMFGSREDDKEFLKNLGFKFDEDGVMIRKSGEEGKKEENK